MRFLLFFVAAVLMTMSANAQSVQSDELNLPAKSQILSPARPKVQIQERQMRTPGTPVFKAPRKEGNIDLWYRRPAGAFPSVLVVEDGAYSGMYMSPYFAVKPYTYYTFKCMVDGVSPETAFEWDVQHGVWSAEEYNPEWVTIEGKDLTFKWGIGVYEMPVLCMIDGLDLYQWAPHGYQLAGDPFEPFILTEYPSYILSHPSPMELWDVDILKSSKNFSFGGRYHDHIYPMLNLSGAEPYGQNETGWWFGKNGYHGLAEPRYFIDGIAQAFEKPDDPYLLNQIVLDCGVLKASGPCEMTCRIYKLDKIPAYNDTACVFLPEVPGELIATGRAAITPETAESTGNLVFFTLYGEDYGLEYEIAPTIDSPILVCIDGYNDPGMENLVDFSAMMCSDDQVDEGFGELAYLKYGRPNANGGIDYRWAGLNNFFSSGTMMTGLTIFLSTELPYLTFNYNDEDGEFTFPNEGGLMEKHFDDYTTRSIEFKSSLASEDDAWYVFCDANEDGEVPEWLSIELTDVVEDGEFTGIVNAEVVADPLPEEVTYREAIVRFEFPGAYVDYKFMQGIKVPPYDPCKDIIDDGEINIADVNYLISLMLEDMYDDCFDVNGDGELTVADINAIIDLILE